MNVQLPAMHTIQGTLFGAATPVSQRDLETFVHGSPGARVEVAARLAAEGYTRRDVHALLTRLQDVEDRTKAKRNLQRAWQAGDPQ